MTTIHLDRRGAGKLLDIRTCDEELLTTGKHDGANVVTPGERAEVLSQLMTHARIERVLGFGTADTHDGDTVMGILQQYDWIEWLAHLCSAFGHADMSAMRNCISLFFVGDRF